MLRVGDRLRLVKPMIGYKLTETGDGWLTLPTQLPVGTLLIVTCYDRVTDDGLALSSDGAEIDIRIEDLRYTKVEEAK